jgi:hypothetical protein
MKIIKAVMLAMLALSGVLAVFLGVFRLGAPAALLFLVLGALALVLWNKTARDPHSGWGTLRAIGWMAALASGVWTLIGFVASGPLVALPLAALFAGSVLWIRHCTRKIEGALARTGGFTPSAAEQNLEAANDLTAQIIANARRSQGRGAQLHVQTENLALIKRTKELEAQTGALQEQLRAREREAGLPPDPFADVIPKA